jgi:hypothetical protein
VPDQPFIIPLENIGHDDAALGRSRGVPVEQCLGLVGGQQGAPATTSTGPADQAGLALPQKPGM